MQKNRWILVVVFLTMPAAKSPAQNPAPAPPAIRVKQLSWADQYKWTNETWTGDDRPYKVALAEVWAMLDNKEKWADYIAKCKALAIKEPSNPLAQYRWAYAVYMEAANNGTTNSLWSYYPNASSALATAPSPHTREYDRVRFIIEATRSPVNELCGLSRRLLAADPKDYRVMYYAALLIACEQTPAAIQEAAGYARQLINHKPTEPSYYARLGDVYVVAWMKHHNKTYGDKAVTALQKYLQLAPPEESRKRAETTISIIQQEEAESKKPKK